MEKDKIKRIFFPKRCSVCGGIIPIERQWCGCCGERYIEVGDNCCDHCGQEQCSCETENSFVLPHITAPFVYEELVRERLLSFKFFGEKKEAEFFGLKMSLRFAKVYYDVEADFVSFVPMREEKERLRGYNQSELLAQNVAKRLFLPVENVLEKTKDTVTQRSLSQKERRRNLENTFKVTDETAVKGKTIILCDDIKTTGTTLGRCVEELFAAGAKDVYCLCAALTNFSPD